MYKRENNTYIHKDSSSILLVSCERYSKRIARWLYKHGYSSLVLEGEYTLDQAKDAVKMCHDLGYTYIGFIGYSTGAIYALAFASVCEDISLVIGLSSMDRVFEDLETGKPLIKDLSYQNIPIDRKQRERLLKKYRHIYKETHTIEFYDYSIAKCENKDAIIPVENINGDIYLFSVVNDNIWGSRQAGQRIYYRLKDKHYRKHYLHTVYKYGTHKLLPIKIHLEDQESKRTRYSLSRKILSILKSWNT